MVRPEIIQKRLARIEEYLTILERLSRYPDDVFLADPEKYGSAERFLQLAIEALNDIGSHLVADQNLGVLESARDIPRALREKRGLDERLAATWVRMIGFRNILVHDYLEVDRRIVRQVLLAHVPDIRALAGYFARFL